MKNLLVVDDEKEISDCLKEYLTDKGFNVLNCYSVDEALGVINSEKLDLVLCDINMPGKTGIELFNEYNIHRGSQEKIPFVLMTGHADIIGVENAFSMGVSELIAKPFDLDSISLVINYLLNLEESKGSQKEKFYAVQIDEFIRAKSSNYDIYLKMVEKYILVTKSGQEFTEQRIANFAKKGATHIYMNSKDFAKYTDLQFAIASTINIRPIDAVRKTKIMNHLIASVGQSFLAGSVESKTFSNALTAFESYTQVAISNTQLENILSHLTNSSPDLIEKSSIKAMISSLIANLWKWNSPKVQSRIILAALMCDISLKDKPQLVKKNRIDYTADERGQYENHPFESFKLLNQIPDMPEEIAIVALQHHENSSGLGFPQRLSKDKLHSYSKLIHCVGEFIEVLYLQKDSTNVQLALDSLNKLQGKMLSEQVIKSLYMVFQAKMPKELEGLLLPSQTARFN